MQIDLKGTPAIIAIIILLAGGLGYRMFLEKDLKDNPELRRQLELNLMYEIAGDIISDTKVIRDAMNRGDMDKAEALAEGTLKRKISITDLALKGQNYHQGRLYDSRT